MTDLQGAWVTAVLLVVVSSVLAAVIQQFSLHFALARARVNAPDAAGLSFFVLWAPTIAVWIALGIALGSARASGRCSNADASALWLGLLYPVTGWPAVWLARRERVRLPGWYFIAQLLPALALITLGGFPCLI